MGNFSYPILHLIMMTFHYFDEEKIISFKRKHARYPNLKMTTGTGRAHPPYSSDTWFIVLQRTGSY